MEQRRFLSGTAAIALVILTVSLAVTPGNAQLQCFSGLNCGGATIPVGGTEEEQIEECCLGDGITFQSGGEACRVCIVYGWLDGPNFSGNETNEPYPLRIGFLKGRDFSAATILSYSVIVAEGTAAEGANADFTVTNRNLLHRTTTTTNPATSVILRVDELAQEIDETFQLTLVPNPASPNSAFSGTNEFLLDTITVTIIDQQRVTFSFPESDYSGPEPDEVITVRVRRNTRIANPVTLLIVPLNYTEFTDSGFVQPIDFPEVPPEPQPPLINYEPNRAKSLPLDRRDFNVTPIEITFEADEINTILDVSVPITIFDDAINEVEEEIFVAVLELVDAIDSSMVDFSDATLCRITDNDPIFIGFERPEYRFDELETVFTQEDSPILIVKENGVVSEQIFRVSITSGAADLQGIGNALFQPANESITGGIVGDYSLGQDSQTLIDLFEAEAQARGFQFSILTDDLPEGPEAFGLTLSTTSGDGGQFSVGTIGSTVVIIKDNDNVIVGFENTTVTVTENELRAELSIRVFVPADTDPLAFTFFLDPTTIAGTADTSDYEALSAFGTNPLAVAQFGDSLRRFSFNITIIDDSLFELTESFSVTIALSSDSPMTGIIVDPSVAVITILDDDAVTIGFDPAEYFVVESAGFVLLNISVLNGSVGTIIGLDLSTTDGSALDTEDYGAITAQTVTFTPTGPQFVQVNVAITDDSRFETLEENFQASLTLISPVNIIRPNAITIAPDVANVTITDDDGIVIGFDPFDYTVLEDAGVVNVTIRLIAGSLVGSSIGVNIFSTDGSAILGQDFSFTSLTLTFDQSNTEVTFQVTILNDVLTELSEIFYLNASLVDSSLAARVLLNPANASVTILDNDTAVIGFDPVVYNVNEDTGFVDLTIRVLQGELAETVFVGFSTRDGTAIAGIDYTFLSQQLSFIGTATQTIRVNITVDTFLEFNENFFGDLVLVPTSLNVTVDPTTATVTIMDDDDAVIGFDPDSYTVDEGAPGIVTFTVRVLTGQLQRSVEIGFSTLNDTALAGFDYSAVIGQTLTFSETITSIDVTVSITSDPLWEIDEQFFAQLTLISTDANVTVDPSRATATILDDDAVTIGFDPEIYTVNESIGFVSLTVRVLQGQLGRSVTLRFDTQDGTAFATIDYTAIANRQLVFDGTTTSFSIMVAIANDDNVEPEEFFNGLLSRVSNATRLTVAPDVATVTITDDDVATIGFTQASYNVIESAGFVTVTVRVTSGTLNRNVVVTLTTADGAAVSSGPEPDFTGQSIDLTFNANTTEIPVQIAITNDTFLEFDEIFRSLVALFTADPAITLAPSEATINIINDDRVVIGFEQPSYETTETDTTSVVEVAVIVQRGILRRDVVVSVFTQDRTAIDGSDYSSISQDLTFNQNNVRFPLNIQILGDGINEPVEFFEVDLFTTDADATLDPPTTTITINDNNPVVFVFAEPMYLFVENVGTGQVCVEKIGNTTQTLRVMISGGLQAGLGTIDQVLTFAPNETELCVDFPIEDDEIALEDIETLTFTLSLVDILPNVTLGDPDTTSVGIMDDDELVITLQKNAVIPEAIGDAMVCINFDKAYATEFEVNALSTANLTTPATPDVDYQKINRTLTATTTDMVNTSRCFPFAIVNDIAVEEPLECLTVEIFLPANAPDLVRNMVSFQNAQSTCCIQDDDVVTIGFDPDTYSVAESVGEAFVNISVLLGELQRAAEVTFSLSSGTAISPMDFQDTGDIPLQFDSITTTITVRIIIEDDSVLENDESFFGELATTDSAVILNPDTAEITIIEDNDEVTIGFRPTEYTVAENEGSVVLTVVVLSGQLAREVSIQFSTSPGTATSAVDYVNIASIGLIFDSTVSENTVTVAINDDTVVEADETFFGNLENPDGDPVILNPDLATVTILDADDTVTIGFEQTVYTAEEGTQVEVCVLVTSGTLERDAVVTLSSSDDTASAANDYVPILEDLTFSASVTEICRNITTLEDGFLESDETFNLDLTTTDGNVILNPDRAVVTIVNDDEVTIGLERTRYDVDEGEIVEVCAVLISGTLQREAVVTLQTMDGSATAPADYTSTTVDLTFDENTNRACANIPTNEDVIYELEELFDVLLTTGDPFVTVAPDEGVVGITDDDSLTIGFEETTYLVNETVSFVEVCAVIIAGTTEIAVDVQFQTRDGSAIAPDDYSSTSATLTFGPGDTGNDCVNIPIVNDGVLEGPQFFFGDLTTTFVDVILNPDETQIIIADIDSITIGFIETTYNVLESAGEVNLLVGLLNGNLDKNVQVRLYTEDGSATAPGDYISIDITLTFNATTSSLSIPVSIVNDVIDENTEQFLGQLELITVANVLIAPAQASVNIQDDDNVTIGLEDTVFVLPESAGTVEVCAVLLDGELERDVIVTLSTSDGSAIAPADYVTANVDLTFNATNTRICVNITIVDDDVFESNETFNVNLNTGDPDVTLDPDEGIILILDDEVITLRFEVGDYNISEPDGPLEVCVVASGTIGTNLPAVTFSYTDGSAEEGSDYSETVTSLLFGPGDSRLCENVPIIDNTILEVLEEDFFIDIELVVVTAEETELASRITLDPSTSTVTIIDDDSVTIGFDQTSYTTGEASGMVTVSVSVLVGVLEQEIEVRIFSMDGTARSPEDYLAIDTTLTFGPGVPTIDIDIVIVDDNADEENMEDFLSILQLITVRDNVDINPDQTTIIIVDDDQVQIGLENTTYTVTEDGGFVEICVRILGTVTLERQAIVTLSTSDDTATDGEDYTGISEDLTFDQNTNRVCVTVNITNDNVREGPEIVNLTITTGDPDVIVVPGEGVIVIVDDDVVTIGFREPSYTFSEAGVTGTIEIVKTGTAAAPFDVFVSGGPSTQTDVVISADGISETITFPAGPGVSIFVTFTITDDDVGLEAVESYVASLELVVPNDGILVDRNTTVINIEDDDDVTVSFGSPRVVVTEGDLVFMMCVVKNRVTIDDVTVTIEDEEGTATRDVDYDSGSIPTTVTIPGDQNRTCFTGDIIDDTIAAEFTENFFLNIIGVSDPDVTVVLDRTEIAIMDDDFAEVRFERETYTVSEGDVVEVCVIKDLETAIPTAVDVQTQDGTAESPADYIGGTFTAQFGTEAGARFCQNIQTVLDTDVEPNDENFLVNIVIIPGSPLRPGTPDTATVFITGVGAQVNDTVIGDPLLTVPIHVPDSDYDGISLCYEIHGADDEYFNLVTDECASVNAHYGRVTEYLNVVDEIAIRAVDNVNECRNIAVNLEGNCSVQVDGMLFTGFSYSNQGVSVRRYRNRVRVSVPNCEELTLVMWIFCETNNLQDPFDGSDVVADMIKFVVMRGLNFGHRNAHGLIGQFWNQAATVTNYTGLLSDGSPSQNRYIVNFTRPGSEPRAFTGYFYQLTWDFKEGPCLYVGNRQAGPIAEVEDPNDSVIEGTYRDYRVANAFQTDYEFGLFGEGRCGSGSGFQP